MQELIVTNADAAARVGAWLTVRMQAGSTLLVIEGLPQSGKTTLAAALGHSLPASLVHLDDVLPKGELFQESWIDAVIRFGGRERLIAAVTAQPNVVIIEGACAGEIVRRTNLQPGPHVTIYTKRLSRSGGVVEWNDGSWLNRAADLSELGIVRAPFMQSIDDYHHQHQPWLTADLVVARIDEE